MFNEQRYGVIIDGRKDWRFTVLVARIHITVGRASWRSSFLGDPGTQFLCGKLERRTKKEKSSKEAKKKEKRACGD